ncbi:MAG: prolipoprotein diacylglyceryl transferase [Candidatus Dormibacteria bacterium]
MTGYLTINVNPVALHIGFLSIHWYGIMYAIAFFVAFIFGARRHLSRRGVSEQSSEEMAIIVIIFGLIGARLYYDVQNNPLHYLTHPQDILAFWQGGMAFFGAIIAGFATMAVLAWRRHLSFWLLADAGAVFAVIGQPIGRIGNLINGDILGTKSNLPWATAYVFPTGFDHCAVLQPGFQCGVPYQPAAAYEAIGTLIILAIIFALRKRIPNRAGILAITYVGLYSLSQILIFFLRASEPVVLLGLKQAQWSGIVGIVIGVPLLILLWKKSPAWSRTVPVVGKEPSTPESHVRAKEEASAHPPTGKE